MVGARNWMQIEHGVRVDEGPALIDLIISTIGACHESCGRHGGQTYCIDDEVFV